MPKHTVFSQLLQLLSRSQFQQCVARYDGDKYTKTMTCWQQLIVLLFAQARGLTSLRDITLSLQSQQRKWYHLGLTSVARSTLADANAQRDVAIFRDMFSTLLQKCRALAPQHRFRFKNPLYTMDSSLISLCLSLFPWARYRTRKGALKLHTLLDHRGDLPSFVTVTAGRCHDLQVVHDPRYRFPQLAPDSILTLDRGYLDYNWLYSLTLDRVWFVTRAKRNLQCTVTGQHPGPRKRGVLADEVIHLTGYYQQQDYSARLRRITYQDADTGKHLVFLTNNFTLAARTIADLYKARWAVETFFRWIKQHLKIKTFLGTSENAVMTQIWVAMIYYLLLAFIKFQTKYAYTLHELTRVIRELLLDNVHLIEALQLKFEKLKRLRDSDEQLVLSLRI